MTQQLTIVMAQVNLMVGDIEGNTRKVIESTRKAESEYKADLVAFPELTLTSYPPEDLLLRPSLKLRVERALQQIQKAGLKAAVAIGYPEQCGGRLYNSLCIIQDSQVLANYRKQCLPNYQVFDERRYFDPGNEACIISIGGIRVGFSICEDLWEPEPTAQVRDAGAQLLININASPYHHNKLIERQQLLAQRAEEGGFPIIYVNLVGGQDELVFDGGSMAVQRNGECCYRAAVYTEGLFPLSISLQGDNGCAVTSQSLAPTLSFEAEVYQALVLGMKDYTNKNHFDGVVLGLSGGIDSALTLAIAVDALGADRVHAVMMPFEYTSQLSLEAAESQANGLGVDYRVISIESIYEAFLSALEDEFAGTEVDVSEQNIQARCRGVLLMAISNKKGYLVLTTGNKSEIAVGYSTLYGDMAGGFDVLKDVPKTLVYRLAQYRNLEYGDRPEEVIPNAVIERPPSAELAPGQLDQDSLPEYETLDQILELYIEGDASASEIIAKGFDEKEVKKVLRLVDLNEYKRRQSPIGVRLTQRGFGRDRRYPITNAWPLGD